MTLKEKLYSELVLGAAQKDVAVLRQLFAKHEEAYKSGIRLWLAQHFWALFTEDEAKRLVDDLQFSIQETTVNGSIVATAVLRVSVLMDSGEKLTLFAQLYDEDTYVYSRSWKRLFRHKREFVPAYVSCCMRLEGWASNLYTQHQLYDALVKLAMRPHNLYTD